LAFKSRSFFGELLSQTLHSHCHETVRILNGTPRLIDKAHLDRVPFRSKVPGFLLREQRPGFWFLRRRRRSTTNAGL
jgi:hypothetical protein